MTESMGLRRKEFLQPSELKGIFVPVVTPFKIDQEQLVLDEISYRRHIARLASPSSRTSGLFLGSNAGQGRDMDMYNLKLSISIGIDASRKENKDLPVVVGALRKTLGEIIDIVKFAEQNGADAIVIAPGYVEEELNKTLKEVCKITNLPIIIYNNPGFQNKTDLPIEFLKEAANNPRVLGIKDTSGKPEYFERVLNIFGSKGKKVMQGDTKAGKYESIRKADGMVPVEANLYSEDLAELLNTSNPFNPKKLEEIMSGIANRKAEIGGDSTAAIKRILVEAGIFDFDLAYPKLD